MSINPLTRSDPVLPLIDQKAVSTQMEAIKNHRLKSPAGSEVRNAIPKATSLMPAMTIPTIGKICVAGAALIGTAVVLSSSINASLILGPLAGVVLLFCALQRTISMALNLGKQGASMAMSGASQVITPQVLAQTATVCNNLAAPCLAAGLQGSGLYQEFTAEEGDTKTQQLALQKQRVSAGVWSTSLVNQTVLASSPKAQMVCWAVMGAMALVTSPVGKTNIPLLEETREKVAAVSNTAMEVMSAGSLGYQVAQSTNSPVAGMVVAGVGAAAATFSSALVKSENGSVQKLQAQVRKVTDLTVKIANSVSISLYVGRFSPALGAVVGVASVIFSLCAFTRTQGIYSGMKSLFSRVTAAVKQKKANEAVIKKEEKVVVQKKITAQTFAKMRQAAMAYQIAQTVVAPGRKGQGRNTTARTTAHEAMFNEAVPKCKKTTTKVAEDL